MPDSSSTEYDLFISHSSGDRLVTVHGRHFRLIDELKRRLEEHYHPTKRVNGRPRRFRVCTFEEDFQLTGGVATAIESQLDRSRAVLVICSEAAADSRYVRSEVEHFRDDCPDRPLIAGFWNVMPDEAFPEVFADDTIGANLQPSIVVSFDDWLEQLDDECHKVVAQAWGLELKDVHDRFVEQGKKRRRRLLAAAAAVVLVLALIGSLAVHQWRLNLRQKAHDTAVIEIEKHGFQVEPLGDSGDVRLVFPGGGRLPEPLEGQATQGLARWAGDLVNVRSLHLSGATVTDETIEQLAALPGLHRLALQRVKVTDASVGVLSGLGQLEELRLDRTLISAVERLQDALPDCRIHHSVERFVDLSGWKFADSIVPPKGLSRRTGRLSAQEWRRVFEFAEEHAGRFGYPESREDSLLLGSFNIRKLGGLALTGSEGRRTPEAYYFLAKVLHAFDLVAVQEVMSDLEELRFLRDLLGPDFELTYSPPSGNIRNRERVAFIHKRRTVRRTEVTGSIMLDSSSVKETLARHWAEFDAAFTRYAADLEAYEERRRSGQRPYPNRPKVELPKSLGFLRTPHMASFELGDSANPYRILAVNAHLQYGDYPSDRRNALELLIRLLVEESRARCKRKELDYPDLVLLGDLNLDYNDPDRDRALLDRALASMIEEDGSPSVVLPFLDEHPGSGEVLRTNFWRSDTFDQIAFLAHDPRLTQLDSGQAGMVEGGFDYGVFDWVCLVLEALPEKAGEPGARVGCEAGGDDTEKLRLKQWLKNLSAETRLEHDVTDHLPIWVRLPAPTGPGGGGCSLLSGEVGQ